MLTVILGLHSAFFIVNPTSFEPSKLSTNLSPFVISYRNTVFPFPNTLLIYRIDEKEITFYSDGTNYTETDTATASVTYTNITEMTYKRSLQGIRVTGGDDPPSIAEFSFDLGDDFWIPRSRMQNITLGETHLIPGYSINTTNPIFGEDYFFKDSIHNFSIFNNQTFDVWNVSTDHNWILYFTKEEGVLVGASYRRVSLSMGITNVYTMNYTLTLESDMDGDGLSDADEILTYTTNPLEPDSDADGLPDGAEILTYNTNPLEPDSDGDGMPDGWEVEMGLNATLDDAAADRDNDGMPNLWEYQMGLNTTLDDSAGDPDGDGMPNLWEYQMDLNATWDDSAADRDNDGMPNLWEYQMSLNATKDDSAADIDGDGMPNLWEYQMGLNATLNDSANDRDSDGLPNLWEYQMGLNATLDDSANDQDGDGLPNLWEYQMDLNATNPRDATFDPDGDGLSNLQEYRSGTDPYDADSDNDFFPDGWDHGWWGNPRTNWDNPLTRGVFLTFLVTLFSLAAWSSFVAYQLPRLHQDLKRQFQYYKQLTNQFLETVKVLQTSENLNAVEAAADDLHHTFQACEESLLFAHRFVKRKWLPHFLRPDLTLWDTIFATVKDTFEEFQQNLLRRLETKY
ncbi:MAG: hypothetical protein ACFFCQ_03425 [Promethearchaeota archaeon]